MTTVAWVLLGLAFLGAAWEAYQLLRPVSRFDSVDRLARQHPLARRESYPPVSEGAEQDERYVG